MKIIAFIFILSFILNLITVLFDLMRCIYYEFKLLFSDSNDDNYTCDYFYDYEEYIYLYLMSLCYFWEEIEKSED